MDGFGRPTLRRFSPSLDKQQDLPPTRHRGTCAEVRASIDAAALANSGDDNDDDTAKYSYFGELPNPDPEDLSPRNVCGDFITLFVGSRKSQAEYPKARKIKIQIIIL